MAMAAALSIAAEALLCIATAIVRGRRAQRTRQFISVGLCFCPVASPSFFLRLPMVIVLQVYQAKLCLKPFNRLIASHQTNGKRA